jgi:hypothetical protein
MQKFITKVSVLALVGAMVVTSMVGCGQTQEADDNSAYVQEVTTELQTAVSEATTTELETEPVTETEEVTTTQETTVAETTEEVTEITEDPAIVEWKNGDYYYSGISDLRDNFDNIYATHFLIGDAIKLYENGTYDGITDGYDLMWKIYDENHTYYLRDFANITSRTVGLGGMSVDSLEATREEASGYYEQMLYHYLETTILKNTTKYNIYDPFENGEAEYKDNTICILWQKEEGTLEGSQTFYYSIPSENYDAVIEMLNNTAEDGYTLNHEFHQYAVDDDSERSVAYMFDVSGGTNTDSSNTENTVEAE